MIDSHCHLAGDEFATDLDAVLARTHAAGLERLLVIVAAEDDAEWERAAALAARDPRVDLATGVHPHQAHRFAVDPDEAARVISARLEAWPDLRAIGEIGLDYHYDFSPREVQQAVFRAQLGVARARDLPVAIHTREAEDDTLALIREAQALGTVRGVFHCFTGGPDTARRALETEFSLSFAGILTFPRAVDLRDACRATPIDRVLVETDAPYLAPVPFRGQRNEPAHVARTAAVVAELHGLDGPVLASVLRDNYHRLFRGERPQTVVPQALSDDAAR